MGGRKKNTRKGVPDFGDDDACSKGWHGRCIHALECQTAAVTAGEPSPPGTRPTFVWKCRCSRVECAAIQQEVEREWESRAKFFGK